MPFADLPRRWTSLWQRALTVPLKPLHARRFTDEPIIIGGCGRSGTTLLLAILSAHPDVYAIPTETSVFCPGAYFMESDHEQRAFPLHRLHARYLRGAHSGATRWCEKTPKNVVFYRRIIEHFEGRVRILNLVRDGRDVVLSRHPSDPRKYWVSPKRWIGDVSAGRALEDEPTVLTLRYEDLVAEFDPTVTRLCDHLGLDRDPRIDAWHEYATVRRNPAWFGKVSQLSHRSIGTWTQPENAARVAELTAHPEACELLERYGYVKAP